PVTSDQCSGTRCRDVWLSAPVTGHQSRLSSICRRPRGKWRAAQAHPSPRILPQFLFLVESACGAGDGLKIVTREMPGDFLVVLRLLLDIGGDLRREIRYRIIVAVYRFRRRIRLSLEVIVYLRPLGVGVGDALEALVRYAFAYRCVDADLGAGGHDA